MKSLLILIAISTCFATEIVVSKKEFISVVGTSADTKKIESIIRVVLNKAQESAKESRFINKIEILSETCNLAGVQHSVPGCIVKYHVDMQ